MNGDGQVLTLSFSRRLVIFRGPTGSRPPPPPRNGADSNRALSNCLACQRQLAVPCFRAGLSRLSCVADFRIATAF